VLKVRDAKSGLGWEIKVDGIVAGLGLEPNSELAKAAGLTIGDGVAVDECLRTSQPDIYAAGDVAEFPSARLRTRTRVEHEDNANRMGKTAGQNMAGGQVAYRH
jgi:3-phenylpropionate/trans-cinnamate dioxygenase ferredoxin reductase subunit